MTPFFESFALSGHYHSAVAHHFSQIFPKTTAALTPEFAESCSICLAADIRDATGSVGVLLSVRPLKSDL